MCNENERVRNKSKKELDANENTSYQYAVLRGCICDYLKETKLGKCAMAEKALIPRGKLENFLDIKLKKNNLSADEIIIICEKFGFDYLKILNLKDNLYNDFVITMNKQNRCGKKKVENEDTTSYVARCLGETVYNKIEKNIAETAVKIVGECKKTQAISAENLETSLMNTVNRFIYDELKALNGACNAVNQQCNSMGICLKHNRYNIEYVQGILLLERYKDVYYKIKKIIKLDNLTADDIIYCCYMLNEHERKMSGKEVISVRVALNFFENKEQVDCFKSIGKLDIVKYLYMSVNTDKSVR